MIPSIGADGKPGEIALQPARRHDPWYVRIGHRRLLPALYSAGGALDK